MHLVRSARRGRALVLVSAATGAALLGPREIRAQDVVPAPPADTLTAASTGVMVSPPLTTRAVADTGMAAADTTPRRRRAIEYSDAYTTRLTIHRYGSYAMLPLFAAEYALGDRLMNQTTTPASWVKPTHIGVAAGLGALFTVNTVTGVWNLYDSRHDPAGRTRRIIHSVLLLASDASMAYTGITTSQDADRSLDGRTRHRNAALTSFGIATAGTVMMWLWR
jgi:hypothetical protein